MRTFAIPFGNYAEIAQLVEHNLAKVRVASSSLVFRSRTGHLRMTFNFESPPDVASTYSPSGHFLDTDNIHHMQVVLYTGRLFFILNPSPTHLLQDLALCSPLPKQHSTCCHIID